MGLMPNGITWRSPSWQDSGVQMAKRYPSYSFDIHCGSGITIYPQQNVKP
jgi:hypothetical protein